MSAGQLIPHERFWMVYDPHGPHPPTFHHLTVEGAKQEAERLARGNPGHRFYVLEATCYCALADVLWADTEDPREPPF